jgi:hypothetical protein
MMLLKIKYFKKILYGTIHTKHKRSKLECWMFFLALTVIIAQPNTCLIVNLFALQPAFNNIFEFIFWLKNIKFDVFYVFLDNFDIIILKIK